jgi:hypothetical protein
MATSAPSEGESTTVYMDDFTLDAFVPKKPFFSYTAIQPYQPCVGNVDLIIFSPNQANCYITEDSLNKLNTIILQNSYSIKKVPYYFLMQKARVVLRQAEMKYLLIVNQLINRVNKRILQKQ